MKNKSNTEVLKSEKETQSKGMELAEMIKGGGLICLYGDLGAGKTTLSKGVASGFSINAFSITSPTYTYIREYPLKDKNFYHIDLYRIEGLDELMLLELEELISNPQNIILIEWADKLGDNLPEERIDVHLDYLSPNEREIKIYDRRRNS